METICFHFVYSGFSLVDSLAEGLIYIYLFQHLHRLLSPENTLENLPNSTVIYFCDTTFAASFIRRPTFPADESVLPEYRKPIGDQRLTTLPGFRCIVLHGLQTFLDSFENAPIPYKYKALFHHL